MSDDGKTAGDYATLDDQEEEIAEAIVVDNTTKKGDKKATKAAAAAAALDDQGAIDEMLANQGMRCRELEEVSDSCPPCSSVMGLPTVHAHHVSLVVAVYPSSAVILLMHLLCAPIDPDHGRRREDPERARPSPPVRLELHAVDPARRRVLFPASAHPHEHRTGDSSKKRRR